VKMDTCKLDDVKLQFYGDTAVLTLRSTEEFTYKGKKERGQYG
jgi:hypothetical protein